MNISEARAIAEAHGLPAEVGAELYEKVLDYATQRSEFWWDTESIAESYFPKNKTGVVCDAIGDVILSSDFPEYSARELDLPREFWHELKTYEGDIDESYGYFLGKYAADCPVRNFGAAHKRIEEKTFEAINRGEVPEGLTERAAICETAAGLLGFPREAGKELFIGRLQDRIQRWDVDTFVQWSYWMDRKYGKNTSDLFKKVVEIVSV
ncbi:MAG: hypothetical protein RMY34_23295 [Aulosira sp. DedQUE10]|nr:hypothetical protein [Aulosira sp. DedQUE10]